MLRDKQNVTLRDKILARIEDRYNIIEVNVKNSRLNNLTITFEITGSVIYLLTTRTVYIILTGAGFV